MQVLDASLPSLSTPNGVELERPLRFIDLFAGLGGFHMSLARLGHECVFASEINTELRRIYTLNHGIEPVGDITTVDLTAIPAHDVLCAGFPCQPFSKAGGQEGFEHPIWGKLFDNVIAILKHHRPKYVMLENVANLEKHNQGRTWAHIKGQLEGCGYDVAHRKLSPHQFGIPQIRERMFIVASLNSLENFTWPEPDRGAPAPNIRQIIELNPPDALPLSDKVSRCLNVWQEFLSSAPSDVEIPYFPLWSMEWGATYPYVDTTPFAVGVKKLRDYRGSHGIELGSLKVKDRFAALPSHAIVEQRDFPHWKTKFIRQNREFYELNRSWIDPWLPKILEFPASYQKLEFNIHGGQRDLSKYLIQFRASGVRVKRPTTSPSLVAMSITQVPIVGWERRYLTVRECSRLQSMQSLRHFPRFPSAAFGALGNAVNTDLVQIIAKHLFEPRAVRSLDQNSLFDGQGMDN